MMRGLWLARSWPFPMDSGDRIYSARLIKSVADAGADLTVVGFECDRDAVPQDWPVRWEAVAGTPLGRARSLLSGLPLVGASHATPAYRAKVAELAKQPWDFVVVDQYGLSWVLPYFVQQRANGHRPVLVHVAHDHEASVYLSLVKGFKGSAPRRLVLWQNWLKTAWHERRLARRVDLLTAITAEDAQRFAADAPRTPGVVLTPGYEGVASPARSIDAQVPRDVVMVGNYNWVAKAENLRQFVAEADGPFHAHGITLHVVGSMSDELRNELSAGTRATVFHGFVADVGSRFAQARLAVVPETIGGGFKLKFLDYIFGRVPVATLAHAAAGLPDDVRNQLICSPDVPSLVRDVIANIDDTALLQTMQQQAVTAAAARFQWADRGRDLLGAVRTARQPSGRSAHSLNPEHQRP